MNKRVLYIVPGLLVLGVDRLVKMLAQSTFPHVLIPGVLAVVPAQNTGMALGLFQNHSYLILIVSVLLVLFSIRLLRRIRPGGLAAASISMIAGGALGNMIDRVARGYVIDLFPFFNWFVFNVADVGVVAGAALCAFSLLFRPQDWSKR